MATPVIVGVRAITATLVRSGIIGKRAVDQWVKGGFKAKIDRKEAIAILGLKFAVSAHSIVLLAILRHCAAPVLALWQLPANSELYVFTVC
ncbi:uncharacterized protein EDB91DRAFT_75810 [Suillus paluster]|uniref:uncharacterized protein n=1 Tax=Suillus paluster TaxID=48578 RepID=UPI001B86396C|nr:uncharacterized protein EDB91DRAFT_75810 [Suillus paluster]KAG1747230.1 hypothetical protein EDB91DRAFT_75810 [Suillus paluster]